MAAPILCSPGIFWLFLLENLLTPIKFLVLGGVGFFFWKGEGGSADFISMDAGIFLTKAARLEPSEPTCQRRNPALRHQDGLTHHHCRGPKQLPRIFLNVTLATKGRSAPKGRQQMGETGFCKNLRFSAVSCENLRFSGQICDSQIS